MTPEAGLHLEKARQCLASARISLGVDLNNDAGRGAYLAVFHAARAFVFERTGKFVKTHQGVQTEFHRLAKDEPQIDKALPTFLSQAYNLKTVADYELGPDSDIPAGHAAQAIEKAGQFLDCITGLLST